jgi:putative methionine-R-sulfoxide reductase with GAF domain
MNIYFAKVYQWIEETKKIAPEVCDWIGVYYKESYLHNIESSDLVIGPYIGEETDHVRISIDRGFCGMALREERTVNVEDVTKDPTHIACSLKMENLWPNSISIVIV